MTKKNRSSRSTRGFTLLEVLIAVLIVGIIATAALPLLGSYTEKAREAREEANMVVKAQAQERYEQDHSVGLGLVYDTDTSTLNEYGMASGRGPTAQLLLPTDSNGNVMGDPVGSSPGPFIHGPYLAQLPPEPASALLATPTFVPTGQVNLPSFMPVDNVFVILASRDVVGQIGFEVRVLAPKDSRTFRDSDPPSRHSLAELRERATVSVTSKDKPITLDPKLADLRTCNVPPGVAGKVADAIKEAMTKAGVNQREGRGSYYHILHEEVKAWNEAAEAHRRAREFHKSLETHEAAVGFFLYGQRFAEIVQAQHDADVLMNDLGIRTLREGDAELADYIALDDARRRYKVTAQAVARRKAQIGLPFYQDDGEGWEMALGNAQMAYVTAIQARPTLRTTVDPTRIIVEVENKLKELELTKLTEEHRLIRERYDGQLIEASLAMGSPLANVGEVVKPRYDPAVAIDSPLLDEGELSGILRNPTPRSIDNAVRAVRVALDDHKVIINGKAIEFAKEHRFDLSIDVTAASMGHVVDQAARKINGDDAQGRLSHFLFLPSELVRNGKYIAKISELPKIKQWAGVRVGPKKAMREAFLKYLCFVGAA